MKSRLYIFFFFLFNIVFPQAGTSAIVEYKQINNTYRLNSYNCTVFMDGTMTIFLPRYLNTKIVYGEKEDDKPKVIYPDWEYLKIDHGKQEMLLFCAFGGTKFLVKDDYNKLNWSVTGDNKVIAGYKCIKATTSFRGVDWEAWFAPEIPLPYGPWKLHGLPGLIMEASEATNTFKWVIETIEYKKSNIFNKDFKKLAETKNKEPMSLREFLKNKVEWQNNVDSEIRQRHPTATIYSAPVRGDFEEKYEWEE